jgi:hypothetical protein
VSRRLDWSSATRVVQELSRGILWCAEAFAVVLRSGGCGARGGAWREFCGNACSRYLRRKSWITGIQSPPKGSRGRFLIHTPDAFIRSVKSFRLVRRSTRSASLLSSIRFHISTSLHLRRHHTRDEYRQAAQGNLHIFCADVR